MRRRFVLRLCHRTSALSQYYCSTQQHDAKMQRYEYDIQLQTYDPKSGNVQQDIHTLNLRGSEGWELVAVSGPIDTGGQHGVAWHYFFRRPLAPDQKNPVLEQGLRELAS